MKTKRCSSISLSLNYLDRNHKRNLIIHTNNNTFEIDFIKGTLKRDQNIVKENIFIKNSFEHQVNSIIESDWTEFCTLKEAFSVDEAIESIEKAAKNMEIIKR